eukprot:Rmarinus@m.7158
MRKRAEVVHNDLLDPLLQNSEVSDGSDSPVSPQSRVRNSPLGSAFSGSIPSKKLLTDVRPVEGRDGLLRSSCSTLGSRDSTNSFDSFGADIPDSNFHWLLFALTPWIPRAFLKKTAIGLLALFSCGFAAALLAFFYDREQCEYVEVDTGATVVYHRTVHLCYDVGASITLVSCLFVYLSYRLSPYFRGFHPLPIVMWGAFSDVVYAVAVMVPHDVVEGEICGAQAALVQFSSTASMAWYFVLSLDLFIQIHDPFRCPRDLVKYYHAFVWSLSVGMALYVVPSNHGESVFEVCWVAAEEDYNAQSISMWITYHLPWLFFFSFSIFVLLYTYRVSRRGMLESKQARKIHLRNSVWHVSIHGMYYLILSFLYVEHMAFVRGSSVHLECSEGKHAVLKAYALLASGRGLLHALLWPMRARQVLVGADATESMAVQGGVDYALRRDLLACTTQGICETAMMSNYPGLSYVDHPRYYQAELRLRVVGEETEVQFFFKSYAILVFRHLREMSGLSTEAYLRAFGHGSESALNRDVLTEKYGEGGSGSFLYFSSDKSLIVKTLSKREIKFMLTNLEAFHKHHLAHPNSLLAKMYGCHCIKMHGKKVYFAVYENVLRSPPSRQITEVFDLKGSWVDRSTSKGEEGKEITAQQANAYKKNSGLRDSHNAGVCTCTGAPSGRGPQRGCVSCGHRAASSELDGSECRRSKSRMSTSEGRRSRSRMSRSNRRGRVKTFKDADLMAKNLRMHLGPETKHVLLAQVETDAKFLCRLGILDYSLLLGVSAHAAPGRRKDLRKVEPEKDKVPTLPFPSHTHSYSYSFRKPFGGEDNYDGKTPPTRTRLARSQSERLISLGSSAPTPSGGTQPQPPLFATNFLSTSVHSSFRRDASGNQGTCVRDGSGHFVIGGTSVHSSSYLRDNASSIGAFSPTALSPKTLHTSPNALKAALGDLNTSAHTSGSSLPSFDASPTAALALYPSVSLSPPSSLSRRSKTLEMPNEASPGFSALGTSTSPGATKPLPQNVSDGFLKAPHSPVTGFPTSPRSLGKAPRSHMSPPPPLHCSMPGPALTPRTAPVLHSTEAPDGCPGENAPLSPHSVGACVIAASQSAAERREDEAALPLTDSGKISSSDRGGVQGVGRGDHSAGRAKRRGDHNVGDGDHRFRGVRNHGVDGDDFSDGSNRSVGGVNEGNKSVDGGEEVNDLILGTPKTVIQSSPGLPTATEPLATPPRTPGLSPARSATSASASDAVESPARPPSLLTQAISCTPSPGPKRNRSATTCSETSDGQFGGPSRMRINSLPRDVTRVADLPIQDLVSTGATAVAVVYSTGSGSGGPVALDGSGEFVLPRGEFVVPLPQTSHPPSKFRSDDGGLRENVAAASFERPKKLRRHHSWAGDFSLFGHAQSSNSSNVGHLQSASADPYRSASSSIHSEKPVITMPPDAPSNDENESSADSSGFVRIDERDFVGYHGGPEVGATLGNPPLDHGCPLESVSVPVSSWGAGDLDRIYYTGIIDYLQEYTWQKKLERLVKIWVLGKDANGISVLPPVEYCERFVAFIDLATM